MESPDKEQVLSALFILNNFPNLIFLCYTNIKNLYFFNYKIPWIAAMFCKNKNFLLLVSYIKFWKICRYSYRSDFPLKIDKMQEEI